MHRFTVIHLQEREFDQALPLVRMAAPMATAERCREFACWLTANCGGIIAAFSGDERPHGIAAYRTEESLVHGLTLKVEPMVTFEINRSAPVRAALCQALELLGMAKGCERLLISTASRGYAESHSAKAGAWARLDFDLVSVDLAKRLEPRGRGAANIVFG